MDQANANSYGERQPFLFHAPGWAEALAARRGCAVRAFDTAHWVMSEQPGQFNVAVDAWLTARAR